jgi:hypothetical protein
VPRCRHRRTVADFAHLHVLTGTVALLQFVLIAGLSRAA